MKIFSLHLVALLHSPSWRVIHLLLCSGAALFWVGAFTLLLWGRKFYSKLTAIRFSEAEMQNLPRLSIIVPACNEAATVEKAMKSLLALDYPDLEIIAVNDRSTDETGAILERLSSCDPRLKVLHVTCLPHGWLGKNHALQIAGEEATGEWLLFTDADVVYQPHTLQMALACVRRTRVDHLVLTPCCETRGFWERLFVGYFGLMFSIRFRLWEVPDLSKKKAFTGLGVFNLVKTESYRRFGGHSALPMEVADDVKLGKVLKANGFRSSVMDGSDLVSVRWVVGLQGAIEGLTKNAFAGLEYSLPLALYAVVALNYTTIYPFIALMAHGELTHILGLIALAAMMMGARAMRPLAGFGFLDGLMLPLGSLLLGYIIIRSTWRTYRQNGIMWRGTLYPLDELRRGVV